MRTMLIFVLSGMIGLCLIGCNCNNPDVSRTPNLQMQLPQQQLAPQPQENLTKPILLGEPTLKQIASDINNRSIQFRGEVWTFKNITGDNVEVVDTKRFGNDFMDVDIHLKVNTKVRTGLLKTTRQEMNACMRISYERSGNLWIPRTITGLQCKPTK